MFRLTFKIVILEPLVVPLHEKGELHHVDVVLLRDLQNVPETR